MGGMGSGTEEEGGQRERGGQQSTEDEKSYVGRGCVRVPGLLLGERRRLGSAPTTFVTEEMGVWSWH